MATGRKRAITFYLDDAVDAMKAAATAQGVNQKVINVGSGTETSVRELIQLISEVTGVETAGGFTTPAAMEDFHACAPTWSWQRICSATSRSIAA